MSKKFEVAFFPDLSISPVYTVTPITEAKGESKEEEKEKKKDFETKDNEKKGILINSSLVVFVLYVVCATKDSCVRLKNILA